MKNNRGLLFSGLALFVCFCLLRGTERLAERFGGHLWLYALAEILSFVLPLCITVGSMRNQGAFRNRAGRKALPPGAIGLSLKMGAAAAAFYVMAHLVLCQMTDRNDVSLPVMALNMTANTIWPASKLFVLVLLPAVTEELFLRGALLTVYEKTAGTGICLIASGLVYALLYGDVLYLIGPFVTGVAYAYLVYSFDSVWPAILAHAAGNLYCMGASWVIETYAIFHIWTYFISINGLLLLLLLYFTMRSEEILLANGSILSFQKGAGLYDLLLLIQNPGIAAFVLAFLAKAVLHLI